MARKKKGERKDGLIQVTLELGYAPNGKRRRKSFYGHTRTEAIAKRDAYIQHRDSGSKYRQDITVAEWVETFKATYRQNVDDAYLVNDDVPYNRLVARLGDMPMVSVTEADLQAALNAVAGMSYSTCDKYRQAMNRVFDRARKNKIIRDNPAEDLVLPPYTKGTHRALETWEIEHILAHYNEKGLVAGLWVMLMLFCGLRRGEMMALEWSAVDLQARTLNIHQAAVIRSNQAEIKGKTKTQAGMRTIPICEPLYNAITSVPEKQRKGFVCVSAHGKQLSESAVSSGLRTFNRAMERLLNGQTAIQPGRQSDLQDKKDWKQFSFRAHDLRHTFATFLYDSGVDVKAAQYYLGHSDIRMTLDLYTHLSKERETTARQKAIQHMNQLFDSRFSASPPYLPPNTTDLPPT